MRIRYMHDYIVIEGDGDIVQRSGINISDLSGGTYNYVPTEMQLHYLYDKARKLKTKDAAAVYVIYRQTFLDKHGKKKKGATK